MFTGKQAVLPEAFKYSGIPPFLKAPVSGVGRTNPCGIQGIPLAIFLNIKKMAFMPHDYQRACDAYTVGGEFCVPR